VSIGFAHLPFHTVAIDGVLETFLGNADEHLNRYIRQSPWYLVVDNPERESCHRLAAATEKHLYQLGADNVLPLGKCGASTRVFSLSAFHLIIYN